MAPLGYTSLQEIRVVMVAKDAEHPGCYMNVWKSGQDPIHEIPFKVIHAPRIQRRKARCNPTT